VHTQTSITRIADNAARTGNTVNIDQLDFLLALEFDLEEQVLLNDLCLDLEPEVSPLNPIRDLFTTSELPVRAYSGLPVDIEHLQCLSALGYELDDTDAAHLHLFGAWPEPEYTEFEARFGYAA